MSDQDSTRRTFLKWSSLGGTAALAGCNALEQTDSETQDPPKNTENKNNDPLQQRDGSSLKRAGIQFADTFATNGKGTSDSPWVVDGEKAMASPGTLFFGEGCYTADQFSTNLDIDYEETGQYLKGTGVRSTTLQKPNFDASFLEFSLKDRRSGNFSGVANMTVYGNNREGPESKGHLIYSTGDIIDLLLENLIVRYGHHDGIHINPSASGTRIHNCWVENHNGWAVWLGSGTRAKVTNQHIVGCKKGGIRMNTNASQLSGISTYACSPGIESRCERTGMTNLYFDSLDVGYFATEEAADNTISNVAFREVKTGFDIQGNGTQFSNIQARQTKTLARVSGNRNSFANIDAGGSNLRISGTENVFMNLRNTGNVVDSGKRTIINGRGTNNGDPNHRGEWNSHADYAFESGTTVWNTAGNQWKPFVADGNGNWIQTA
ncbi:Right handed beta helix region [Halogranum amylolyticum]|uniref:Right handed beta helix region n=1 Tax=Halogranum amylolyticum TaxID=660520 RepID=A0A1H8WRW2_9EURY|nr:twin-arginine translocation signal domain-containing protein [Halogranum amylolyticum]SEP30381.1 Right handed beta helix region [Halogranum amylolyticum]